MLAFVFCLLYIILFLVKLKNQNGIFGKVLYFLFPICAQVACSFAFNSMLKIKNFGLGAIGVAIVLYVFGAVPLISAVMGLIGRSEKKFNAIIAAANACGIVLLLLIDPIRIKNLITFLIVFGYVTLMFFITMLCSYIKLRVKR